MPAPAAESDRYDVAVVGAGPVGLTIANYLGCLGVRVLVVEQRDTLIDYPRGVGMDDECLRSFQAIGLADAVVAHTIPGQKMRFLTMTGKTFALIDPQTKEFGWPRRSSFIQPMIDRILLDGLARFDTVRVEFGTELVSFADDGAGVRLELKSVDRTRAISAAWLVGCDGGRSIVRKALGIEFDGITDATRWVVIDLKNDPVGLPDSYLYCVPSRPYVSIALPHGMRRLEFMVFGDEADDELCSPAGIRALLARALPHPERADVLRSRVYTHNARLARAFGRGRALIAGDAAHLMPVWQGQGYNSGIRDATNLAWKLALAVRGQASADLVATYEAERREHAKAMIDLSVIAGRVFAPTNKLVAWLRDQIGLALTAIPPVKRYFVQMRFKPMPRFTRGLVLTGTDGRVEGRATGKLFPQPDVLTVEGQSRRLDDMIGVKFAVMSWGCDPQVHLSDQMRTWWAGLGAAFVVVVPRTQLQSFGGGVAAGTTLLGDATGALHEWFAAQDSDGSIVVLRPDRVVAAIVAPQLLDAASRTLRGLIGGRAAAATAAPAAAVNPFYNLGRAA